MDALASAAHVPVDVVPRGGLDGVEEFNQRVVGVLGEGRHVRLLALRRERLASLAGKDEEQIRRR